ncbi:MAG: phenylacetate-CoA oxygenase subunit PaaI [Roseovarius sp.]
MSAEMSLAEYLARGGRLTSPANVPPRYRAELLRIMTTFVDSELAGAAGFADLINAAPGIEERIAAARIVLEKTVHAQRVLRLMGEFGADAGRYYRHHPWHARSDPEAGAAGRAARDGQDMRLAVFDCPLGGWTDAVVMNALMGRAAVVQLRELARVSYQPLAEAFAGILPVETRHAELGLEGMERLLATQGAAPLQAAIDRWWPRVSAAFGGDDAARFARLAAMGLRHAPNAALRGQWETEMAGLLAPLGLRAG